MVNSNYVPDQGDIIMIDLDPQKGAEMAKRRPCLVLSKKILNLKTKRAVVCPITSSEPFSQLHIVLPASNAKVSGTLVLDQIRTLDFKSRKAQKVDKLFDLEFYDHLVNLIYVMIKR